MKFRKTWGGFWGWLIGLGWLVRWVFEWFGWYNPSSFGRELLVLFFKDTSVTDRDVTVLRMIFC